MKAAEKLFFMLHIGEYVLQDCYSRECGEVVIRFFKIVRKAMCWVVDPTKLESLYQDIAEWLSLHELRFPSTEMSSVFHRVLHIPKTMEKTCPLFVTWMFPYDRYLAYLTIWIKNKRHPEENILSVYRLMRVTSSNRHILLQQMHQIWPNGLPCSFEDRVMKPAHGIDRMPARQGVKMMGASRVWKVTERERKTMTKQLHDIYIHTYPAYRRLYTTWQATAKNECDFKAWVPLNNTKEHEEMTMGPRLQGKKYTRCNASGMFFRGADKERQRGYTGWLTVNSYCEIQEQRKNQQPIKRVARIHHFVTHRFCDKETHLGYATVYCAHTSHASTGLPLVDLTKCLDTRLIDMTQASGRVMLMQGPDPLRETLVFAINLR